MTMAPIFPAEGLEVRQQGGRPTIHGRFPYKSLAVISDRGKVRKETIEPGAFKFALDDPDRDIHLLVGHDFGKPIASKATKSLTFQDGEEHLAFRAELAEGAERVSWVSDLLAMLAAGLIAGVSPGFRVPPSDVVPGAERLEPEKGNPGVFIRVLFALVLYELSLVTRPAYEASQAELRAMNHNAHPLRTHGGIWLP